MHPTLRYGSSGLFVVELQTKLNLIPSSMYPPLKADGAFGNKTLARVKEFQAARGLVVDGVVGQQTWAALDPASAGPPTQYAVDPRALGALRVAGPLVGKVDYSILEPPPPNSPRGWSLLGTMIAAATGQVCTPAELKKSWTPRGINWCGIFCVYCYQLGGAPHVRWNLAVGKPTGFQVTNSWTVFPRGKFESGIRPGDIGVIADQSHHFLIESIDPAAHRMVTLEGNTFFGRTVRSVTRHPSVLVAYYRLI